MSDRMKKVKMYKGYVIAQNSEHFQVFTKDEWSMGEGCRYPEFDDCGSIEECISNIEG